MPSAFGIGHPLVPFPSLPPLDTLTRSVTPVWRSRTKMSVLPLVSPDTRFVADELKGVAVRLRQPRMLLLELREIRLHVVGGEGLPPTMINLLVDADHLVVNPAATTELPVQSRCLTGGWI